MTPQDMMLHYMHPPLHPMMMTHQMHQMMMFSPMYDPYGPLCPLPLHVPPEEEDAFDDDIFEFDAEAEAAVPAAPQATRIRPAQAHTKAVP